MKKLYLFLFMGLFVFGCGYKDEIKRLGEINDRYDKENRELKAAIERLKESDIKLRYLASRMKGVKASIITTKGNINIKFFPLKAPIHCFAFITRAESGFYDNTHFHRVIKDFMIQGGDPNSKDKDPYNDGSGGPITMIPHEFNYTHHKRGIVSMARAGDKRIGAGSQFFIMHKSKSHLDNEYTVFAEVTDGMDTVDKIANAKIRKNDKRLKNYPLNPVKIKTIKVYR